MARPVPMRGAESFAGPCGDKSRSGKIKRTRKFCVPVWGCLSEGITLVYKDNSSQAISTAAGGMTEPNASSPGVCRFMHSDAQ